jgi:hypothetical protein
MTTAIETKRQQSVDMKLGVIVIPVSDVDRAKRLYEPVSVTREPPTTRRRQISASLRDHCSGSLEGQSQRAEKTRERRRRQEDKEGFTHP